MAREADAFGVSTAVLVVAPGATNALLVAGIPGQNSWILKYGTGASTLEMIGAPPVCPNPLNGTTGLTAWSATQLVALAGTGYAMGSEVLSGDGPTRFYLMATGGTATCYLIRGLGSGF